MNYALFLRAFRCSIPVMLGYIAIGVAFGLMCSAAEYPWFVALAMSVIIYAGAGQYIAVALFAAGSPILNILIVEFIVNARHIAYGITMLEKYNAAPRYKPYLIFSLTDETFALLSSFDYSILKEKERGIFMFFVSALNQFYWIAGSVIGALALDFLPFSAQGVEFALTALFIVLLLEQIFRIKRAGPFVAGALCAVLAVVFLPKNISIIAALAMSLAIVQLTQKLSFRRVKR
ncbi:MAG: AzlC family ABC transporter permease [Termitinemataceae bacterium]|nr:MAG: AzlC family ABC transporter permease [Termitinemataceae bacterium]